MDRAVELIRDWCAARTIAGLTVEVHELPGRTPVILMEIPAFNGGSPTTTRCCCTATSTSSRR